MMDNKKILFIAGGVFVFVLIIVILAISLLSRGIGPVTITMWGMWEPESVYSVVADDYHRAHPNVTVKYIKQSPLNYRDRAISALALSDGPDIVLIHNSWLPMFVNSVAPVPADVMSPSDFRSAFYPTATADLMAGGKPYALPTEIDDLGLYVNQDIFNAAGVSLPTTWDEFRTAADKLTVRDSGGRIKTAGAALGAVSNVDHWQDILSLMMLQAGVNMNTGLSSDAAAGALSYYTTFVTVDKVWDETQDASTLAFAQGKLAMYFGPSWRFFDFKQINPNLNFKVIPVPQLTGGAKVNLASYWAAAVSAKSPQAKTAWDFVKFAASQDELTKLYAAESKLREFGEPYPLVAMATMLSADPNAGPFVLAGPTAKSSYLVSATNDGDTGINSRIGKYYVDAINGVLKGTDPKTALATVQQGVTQVLQSYGAK
ncbi:MAG: extracellular solute-binding protein [Patescibacteria group bacterium]|nr:extracellular solute-binding protein [Patescibacteria group bacterium]MCL5431965.1 extracellular solute-binding protein [Patescibacteria group bacterium]